MEHSLPTRPPLGCLAEMIEDGESNEYVWPVLPGEWRGGQGAQLWMSLGEREVRQDCLFGLKPSVLEKRLRPRKQEVGFKSLFCH